MLEEIAIHQAKAHTGKQVRVHGHLAAMRDLGQIAFLVLRGRTGNLSIVVEEEGLLAQVRTLALETPVIASGTLKEKPAGKGKHTEEAQAELHLEELKALTGALSAPPIEIGKQTKMDELTVNTLLDYRPLSLRNEKVKAIFKLEAEIVKAFRHYLESQGFTEIHSPKLVATGTEGGSQLFAVDYFGRRAYLAQSPQFYKQIMVAVFERVFEVGPVFRAEEHDSTRHLNEYISLDFEMGFIESVQDVIAMQVGLIKHMLAHLKEHCAAELSLYNAQLPEVESIPQIRLAEAMQLLCTKYNWAGEDDLDGEGERLLCEHFHKESGSDFVYVTDYPHRLRPFYAMPGKIDETGQPGSESFDLLFRGLEVTTGGQRIHEHERLVEAIRARGMDDENFRDYLLCFKHGMPPHGGLAFGLERLAKQFLGLASVKQAALFPRDMNRISP